MSMMKATFAVCLFMLGFSSISCQSKDEALTKLFQGLVDDKLVDHTGRNLGHMQKSRMIFDEGKSSWISLFPRIQVDKFTIDPGFTASSVSNLAAHYDGLLRDSVYKGSLTFQLVNGQFSSSTAQVLTSPNKAHKGNYKTGFESAQFELNFLWYSYKRELQFMQFDRKLLWANGVTTSWSGFDVDVEQIMKDDDHMAEKEFNDLIFTYAAKRLFSHTALNNEAFVNDELTKIFGL